MTKTNWTASCLIIGDEILSGKTQDSNSFCLARFLFDLGIELKRIEVVPDNEQEIGEAAKRLSANHDFVFTSGGIGTDRKSQHAPLLFVTHDDITYSSIAKGFGLSMKLHDETWKLVQQLKERQQSGAVNSTKASIEGYKRLATFPSPGEHIRAHAKIPIPVVVVNTNVYILPGIPRLFQALLHSLSDHLKQRIPFYRRQVATKQSETLIADILSQLQDDVQRHHIKIGSYPVSGDSNGIKVVISIVGKDLGKVDQITKLVVAKIDGYLLPAKL
ncbi:MoaB/Mog domain-containing protein [Absidia repens]|uniref:MoaB/Mog domain-containing protein n=1 Tax=Absidia repens TaxID=90262 RepID=A0A1X2IAM7_9FUNG|nr:MoaB/Mog domain-containing protein [Absidia repens]